MTHEELRARYEAHRAVHAAEHDPAHGRLHGCCLVCGVPWPCEYAGSKPGDLARFEIIEPKHADLLRERDEARAELADLRAFREANRGIPRMQTATEMVSELDSLRAEVERLRQAVGLATTAVPSMVVDASDPVGMMQRVVAEVEWLRLGRDRDIDALQAEVERLTNERNEALQAQLDLMRGTTQPAVYMTDIEAAARELEGMGFLSAGFARTMLAKHTRPLDREGLAAAMWDDDGHGKPWNHRPITEDGRGEYLRTADAVLRHLGAQPVESIPCPFPPGKCPGCYPSEQPKPPEPNSIGAMFVPNCEREQPEPPEPAKVRVKLPKTIYDKERRTLTVSATELRASLRSQGVEVDDE